MSQQVDSRMEGKAMPSSGGSPSFHLIPVQSIQLRIGPDGSALFDWSGGKGPPQNWGDGGGCLCFLFFFTLTLLVG